MNKINYFTILLLLLSLNLSGQEQSALVTSVLKQLNINISNCKTNLIVEKVMPNNSTKTIIVIPEFSASYNEKEDCCFFLNSYILIVNNLNNTIENTFFESSESNGWESDAVVLSDISIDTAPYYLSNEKRAFGIRVKYNGSSRVDPFGYETISLFEPQNNTLKRLLKNYKTETYNGSWDGMCLGEFNSQKSILQITDNLTNSHLDILVKTEITNSKTFIDKDNNCNQNETVTKSTKTLKYKNGTYTENVL